MNYKEKFFEVENEIARLRLEERKLAEARADLDKAVATINKIKSALLPFWKENLGSVSTEHHFRTNDYYDRGASISFKDDDIISTIVKLVEMYGREDEGTALMQEQIDNLMLIIRTQMNDNTRASDRFEQEAKYKSLMCPSCNEPWGPDGRCTRCNYRRY